VKTKWIVRLIEFELIRGTFFLFGIAMFVTTGGGWFLVAGFPWLNIYAAIFLDFLPKYMSFAGDNAIFIFWIPLFCILDLSVLLGIRWVGAKILSQRNMKSILFSSITLLLLSTNAYSWNFAAHQN
jgi:hypothetical protein